MNTIKNRKYAIEGDEEGVLDSISPVKDATKNDEDNTNTFHKLFNSTAALSYCIYNSIENPDPLLNSIFESQQKEIFQFLGTINLTDKDHDYSGIEEDQRFHAFLLNDMCSSFWNMWDLELRHLSKRYFSPNFQKQYKQKTIKLDDSDSADTDESTEIERIEGSASETKNQYQNEKIKNQHQNEKTIITQRYIDDLDAFFRSYWTLYFDQIPLLNSLLVTVSSFFQLYSLAAFRDSELDSAKWWNQVRVSFLHNSPEKVKLFFFFQKDIKIVFFF